MYSHERPQAFGTYIEDYNIVHLHSLIKASLEKENNKLALYSKELRVMSEKLEQPQTIGDRKVLIKKQTLLQEYISEVKKGTVLNEYTKTAGKIIEEYKSINAKTKNGGRRKIIFGLENIEKDSQLSTSDTERRLELIEHYLRIASNYADFAISRQYPKDLDCCIICSENLIDSVVLVEGLVTCPNCGAQQDPPHACRSIREKPSNSIENTDDSIDNFLRAFYRYQGIQSVSQNSSKIKDDVYKALDNYFIRISAPIGEEIKKLPLNARGRRGNTNHTMLWEALGLTGYGEYYEHANLIGHNYFGWSLPNVMHLKDLIISDYNKTQAVLRTLPHKERSSSLGVQYRLWRHLQLRGHPCSMDEFKIPQHPDSFHNNDTLWRLMCSGAGDSEIYYIES